MESLFQFRYHRWYHALYDGYCFKCRTVVLLRKPSWLR